MWADFVHAVNLLVGHRHSHRLVLSLGQGASVDGDVVRVGARGLEVDERLAVVNSSRINSVPLAS